MVPVTIYWTRTNGIWNTSNILQNNRQVFFCERLELFKVGQMVQSPLTLDIKTPIFLLMVDVIVVTRKISCHKNKCFKHQVLVSVLVIFSHICWINYIKFIIGWFIYLSIRSNETHSNLHWYSESSTCT